MIVALGLPLKVATIILGCILSMLLGDFNALGPISMPTPPTVALTEFFHADTVASVHPLPVMWYLISSLCVYLCSCMHIMSILCSTADAVSSGSWPILFKILTSNVAICIVWLHFCNFLLFELCSWFFEHWGQGSNLSRTRPFFTRVKSDTIYVCGLSVGHSYLSMAVFIFIYRSHSYRGAAVVPRSNWRSWALSRETHTSRTRLGIAWAVGGFIRIPLRPSCCFPCVRNKKGLSFPVSFNLVKVQD